MLPPQADGKEGPGEITGCAARFEALDLNHANWQAPASLLMPPFLEVPVYLKTCGLRINLH